MSDQERRRQEEERRRFERIRNLDTGAQQTQRGRRGHPAGAQPFHDPLDPYSRGAPRPQTRPYGAMPPDMYLSQQFGQSMNLGAQPYQQGGRYGQQQQAPHRMQPAPSGAQQWGHRGGGYQPQPARSAGPMSGSGQLPYGWTQRPQQTLPRAGMSGSSHRPHGWSQRGQPVHPSAGMPGSSHRPQQAPSALSRHIASQQASSQSVRPKQSPTGIPQFARQQPIPEPALVGQYRDPVTGMPSSDRLRSFTGLPRPWSGGPPSSSALGSYLANLSRDNISFGVLAHDKEKQRRQKEALLSRGFQRVEDRRIRDARPAERFAPQSTPSVMSQRRRFMPQTERDRISSRDYRFNRPQRDINKPLRQISPGDKKIAPVGRQQYGQMRRAYSMPDLSDPNLQADIDEPSRMNRFADQYVRLPTADRESYRRFHDQVSLEENPHAKDRMVPRPTIGNIRETDRKRMKDMAHARAQMMQYRIGEVSADKLRRARRSFVRDAATQETSLPTKTAEEKALAKWLALGAQQRIPEGDEEEDEEE